MCRLKISETYFVILTYHMSSKSSANWCNRKFDQPEMIQSMINRPEMLHVQYNPDWVFSIMLSIKIQFEFDKHSVVIKKIGKIIITFYVFINLQFLINRFQRDGAKNSQQFDSFKGFGRLRLHRACWVKWSLSGSISIGQGVTVVRWYNSERLLKIR